MFSIDDIVAIFNVVHGVVRIVNTCPSIRACHAKVCLKNLSDCQTKRTGEASKSRMGTRGPFHHSYDTTMT